MIIWRTKLHILKFQPIFPWKCTHFVCILSIHTQAKVFGFVCMCVLEHTTFFTCLIHKWVYQIVEHLGKPPFLSQLWLCYFELKIFTSSLLFFVHYIMRLTTFEFRHMTNILKPKYVRSHERIRNVFFKLVIQMRNVINRMNRIIFKDFFHNLFTI